MSAKQPSQALAAEQQSPSQALTAESRLAAPGSTSWTTNDSPELYKQENPGRPAQLGLG